MAIEAVALYKPDGVRTIELTPLANSATWSAAAVGGFASATFDLPGWVELNYLADIEIQDGDVVVWEGRVEDCSWRIAGDERFTSVSCIGYRALIEGNSTRRIWSKRDLDWQDVVTTLIGISGVASITREADLQISTGVFDSASSTTESGVRVTGRQGGGSLSANEGRMAEVVLPIGTAILRVMADVVLTGPGTGPGALVGYLQTLIAGGTTINDIDTAAYTSTQSVNEALIDDDANIIRLGAYSQGSPFCDNNDIIEWSNIRLLGTSVTEDATGGFYGGTLIRDVLTLVPEIKAGVIESGNDFVIDALERSSRGTLLGVIEEIASYYTHEWGVWEGPRLDWRAVDFDQPDYVIDLNEVLELDLTGSVEGVAKTYYVSYTDAASGVGGEQSAVATSQRNPYVRTGRSADFVYDAPFPMTANTAAQLSARIAAERGEYVPANGTIVLPVTARLDGITRSDILAAHLRPGVNVLIPDLPVEDIAGGRDGRSLLHVSSVDVDLNTGRVTLEVDSAPRGLDVLFARLAAVTRTVQSNFR